MDTKWLIGCLITVWFTSGCTTYRNLEPGTSVNAEAGNTIVRPILYLDADGISRVYPDGRRLKTPLPYFGAIPTRSPDGLWFAYIGQRRDSDTPSGAVLELMNLQGTVKTLFTTEKETIGPEPIWSPDGQKIAVITREGQSSPFSVAVISVSEQKVASRFKLPTNIMSETNSRPKFRWSPDGQKILLAWNITLVINTLNGIIETVAENPSLAEWASDNNGIYFFSIPVPHDPRIDLDDYFTLDDLYFKPLGSAEAIKLMDKEQVKKLGLIRPFQVQGYDLFILSRSGSRLAIWGSSVLTENGVAKRGTCVLHIYNLEKGKIDKLDKPFKTFQTEDLCLAFDWSPDENSLAAVASEGPSIIGIKLIDLKTGDWKILATVPRGGESYYPFYLHGFKVMSWAQ